MMGEFLQGLLGPLMLIAFVLWPLGLTIAGIGYFTLGNVGNGLVALLFGIPNLLIMLFAILS